VVDLASELEVRERIGSALRERNAVMDLQPFAAAADDADSVALMDKGSEPAPFPA
jgi:hypothetical protein